MAKNYSKKAPKNKVTKDELSQLQNFVSKINGGQNELGLIELKKHNLLHAINQTQNDLNIFQVNLIEKYGKNVKIDINDGSITPSLITDEDVSSKKD